MHTKAINKALRQREDHAVKLVRIQRRITSNMASLFYFYRLTVRKVTVQFRNGGGHSDGTCSLHLGSSEDMTDSVLLVDEIDCASPSVGSHEVEFLTDYEGEAYLQFIWHSDANWYSCAKLEISSVSRVVVGLVGVVLVVLLF